MQKPIACDLSVLTEAEREAITTGGKSLFAMATELRAMPDGFALGFEQASADTLRKLAEFIAYDRLCCAFLRHALVSEPGRGTTWLEMTGGPGAKEAIAADLLALVRPDVARAAGLTTA
jgi:hypothetical protein